MNKDVRHRDENGILAGFQDDDMFSPRGNGDLNNRCFVNTLPPPQLRAPLVGTYPGAPAVGHAQQVRILPVGN